MCNRKIKNKRIRVFRDRAVDVYCADVTSTYCSADCPCGVTMTQWLFISFFPTSPVPLAVRRRPNRSIRPDRTQICTRSQLPPPPPLTVVTRKSGEFCDSIAHREKLVKPPPYQLSGGLVAVVMSS